MDATTKTANSVHRMKRAYTKKAVPVLEGADVKDTSREDALAFVEAVSQPDTGRVNIPSQIYALRVWEGQSIDLPTAERLARVRAALWGQNLSTDGVVLEGLAL